MDPHDDFARRAALRASWSGRLAHRADADEAGDLSATTTAEQRVGMLWELTLGAWALTGKPLPDYARAQMPGQIVREPLTVSLDAQLNEDFMRPTLPNASRVVAALHLFGAPLAQHGVAEADFARRDSQRRHPRTHEAATPSTSRTT